MALRSMTGFGQAESNTPTGTYRVEIRSVNGRYLDVQLRLPKVLTAFEQKVRQRVSAELTRGSVTVLISRTAEDGETRLSWDREAVSAYVRIFREMGETLQLRDEVSLSQLLQFSDVIKTETVALSEKELWRDLKPILAASLTSFVKSRTDEGRQTERDLRKALRRLSTILKRIEKRAPLRLRAYEAELRKRIQRLIDKAEAIDESRFAMEVAIMADKFDIAEECARLWAHIEKFLETLDADEPTGKHLGFLLQELNREANTICSKANDAQIAHWGVELKEQVERLREQIQNIE